MKKQQIVLLAVVVLMLLAASSLVTVSAAPPATPPLSKFTPNAPTVPSGPPATSQLPPATPGVVHTQVPPTVPPPTVPPPTVPPPTVPPPTVPPTGPTNTPVSPPPGATVTRTPVQPLVVPSPTPTKAVVRMMAVPTPSCVTNTVTMADGTRDFVEICPGTELLAGKWVVTGDNKFADAATFVPGSCGEFTFYLGVWNKNKSETVTVLPASIAAKFPMTDTFPSDFRIKDVQIVGPTVITYTLNANTIVVNSPTDFRPSNDRIFKFNENLHYASFAGVAVLAELCR